MQKHGKILTSVWSVQLPNGGQNMQHTKLALTRLVQYLNLSFLNGAVAVVVVVVVSCHCDQGLESIAAHKHVWRQNKNLRLEYFRPIWQSGLS